MKFRLTQLLTICLGAWIAPTYAADPLALEDEDLFSDLPVLVSVTRLPQRRQDVPASVTVIDRDMIEASGAKEIPELFRMVAGFVVGHSNAIGPRATVSYLGVSDDFARRMQVLVDGRSIYTPAYGGVDWYGLPITMEDIERIEVTRGPNGVTYGANSFLGVINIVTYHPSDVQGTLVKSTIGEGDFQKNILRHAGSKGDLSYRVSLEFMGDDGNPYYRGDLSTSDLEELGIADPSNEPAERDDKDIRSVTVRADYRRDVNEYLTVQLGGSNALVGDGVENDPLHPTHENENKKYFAQVKWKRVLSSDEDLELNIYHNYNDSDADYSIGRLSEVLNVLDIAPFAPAWDSTLVLLATGHEDDEVYVPVSHEMKRSNIEFTHRSRLSDVVRLVWGAEARKEQVKGTGLIGSSAKTTNVLYRLFFNTEWKPDSDWVINTGAMVENNDITETHVSPRIAANYHLNERHTLRAAYSKNYRTPAMWELYTQYGGRFATDDEFIDVILQGNDDLEPEQNTSVELGLIGRTLANNVEYDVRMYHEKIRDIIAGPTVSDNGENSLFCTLLSDCESYTFHNGGYIDITGIDVQTSHQAGDSTRLTFGYSRKNVNGKILEEIDATSNKVYEDLAIAVPVDTLSLLFDQKLSHGWRMSLGYYHIANMAYVGSFSNETGGIDTFDIRLAKEISMGAAKGNIAIVTQDVTGTYFDFRDEIARSPRTYLSAEIKF